MTNDWYSHGTWHLSRKSVLYFYKNKWLLNTAESDLHKACPFSNTFRFIENLRAINDHLKFNRSFKNTYPSELQLKKEKVFQFPKHHF